MHRQKRALSTSSSGSEDEISKTTRTDYPPLATSYSCSLPPTCSVSKPSTFDTSSALDAHHASHHAFHCTTTGCNKIFPDERFMNLHFSECHDPLVAVKADRGDKIFQCFELSCKRNFRTPKTRRLHLIDAHQYPKTYYFSLPAKGLNDLYAKYGAAVSLVRPDWKARDMDQDGQSSTSAASSSPPTAYLTLQRTRSIERSDHGEERKKDEEQMDSLAQRFAETKMLVPNQVRFGKKASKK